MIRKAALKDIPNIHLLLKIYGEQGRLLSRPLSQLYDHLRDFWVFSDDADGIIGCCALQFCWSDLAEIRSLAVHPDRTGQNIGIRLMDAATEEAVHFGITRLFTLTYVPDFFAKAGFIRIDRSELPLKIWSDCISCVKFPDCDENALMKIL